MNELPSDPTLPPGTTPDDCNGLLLRCVSCGASMRDDDCDVCLRCRYNEDRDEDR